MRRGNTTEPRIVTAEWSNPGQTHASRASWRHGQGRIVKDVIGRPQTRWNALEAHQAWAVPTLLFSDLRPTSTGRLHVRAVSTCTDEGPA